MKRKVREQAGDKRKEVGDDTIVCKPSGPLNKGRKASLSIAMHLL